MAIIYDAPSANWATATETTDAPRVVYPIAQNTSAIIYERDYVQNEANWAPTAMDTADGTYSSAYLVEETTPQQVGGTLVRWTKRFATVPSNWTDYDQRPFTFPGFFEDDSSAYYRVVLNQNVTWEINLTYQLTTNPYSTFPVASYLFQVKLTDGTVVDYVDDTNTDITYTDYDADVTAETLINVAHSTLERYAGNIWVQKRFRSKAL
jgi:hypothetical protein